MAERPQIKIGDWITIENGHNKVKAVVCAIYSLGPHGYIEVVYLDDQDKAINADVAWDDEGWSFKGPGLSGRYENKDDRLCNLVSKLRSGKD